jgi:hypothetical protein
VCWNRTEVDFGACVLLLFVMLEETGRLSKVWSSFGCGLRGYE